MRRESILTLAALAVAATTLAVSTVLTACTETPSYFPPCVDPDHPCAPYEAGVDASDGGVADAPGEASDGGVADAPGEATEADAP